MSMLRNSGRFYCKIASHEWATETPRIRKLADWINILKRGRGDGNTVGYAFGLYAVFTLIFLFVYSLPISPQVAAIRVVSGLCAVILFPGIFVAHCVLPKRLRNLATGLVLGLMLAIGEIHLLFAVTLAASLQVPLVLWLCVTNTLVMVVCSMWLRRENSHNPFQMALFMDYDKRLLLVAIVALVVRFALLYLAQGSIAPDASLYSDYARSVIEGTFQSSVLNDNAVTAISSSADYLEHQAIAYVFAVSWVLLPPATSGPILLLILIGVALLFPIHSIVNRFFGPLAAICVAFIVALHPLFVFHSSVAYGPEITSLLFIVCAMLFFMEGQNSCPKVLFVSGLLIGFTDVIWYANFYAICITLPAILFLLKMLDRNESLVFSAMMLLVIFAMLLYRNIAVFFACWTIIFVILALIPEIKPDLNLQRFAVFFGGIASVIFLWSWPLRVTTAYSPLSAASGDSTMLVSTFYTVIVAFSGFWLAILAAVLLARRGWINSAVRKAMISIMGFIAVALLWILLFRIAGLVSDFSSPQTGVSHLASAAVSPMSIPFLLSFLFFMFFHISTVLLCLVPLALVQGRNKSAAVAFSMIGVLAAFGTLRALSGVSGSLGLEYLYSDSRFFLFVALMCIISLGAYFAKLTATNDDCCNSTGVELSVTRRKRKCVIVLSLIIIGFVPSYLVMPSGLALVNIEERYAWSGLPSAVNDMGDDSAVFLVDRAREFAWFTGRKSAVLKLSNMSLPYANASRELLSLAANFSTDYLIADGYTLAHWRTLDFLLLEPISIGTSVILGNLEIVEFYESSNNISAPALTLIAQTESNAFGSYCRVFGFGTVSFTKSGDVSILGAGWNASNGGSITNASGEVQLTIGSDQNSTNTWRPEGFDFDQMVNSGFLLLDLEEISATVARIEVWDENGIILRHAENLGNGIYYCPLGEVTIGDIRIVIEGSSGESIIVRSISVWQVENP